MRVHVALTLPEFNAIPVFVYKPIHTISPSLCSEVIAHGLIIRTIRSIYVTWYHLSLSVLLALPFPSFIASSTAGCVVEQVMGVPNPPSSPMAVYVDRYWHLQGDVNGRLVVGVGPGRRKVGCGIEGAQGDGRLVVGVGPGRRKIGCGSGPRET